MLPLSLISDDSGGRCGDMMKNQSHNFISLVKWKKYNFLFTNHDGDMRHVSTHVIARACKLDIEHMFSPHDWCWCWSLIHTKWKDWYNTTIVLFNINP